METIVDLRSFNPTHITSLVFSIFESLRDGQSFLIIDDKNPHYIQKQFIETSISDFKWEVRKKAADAWEAKIIKLPSEHKTGSCCGMCNG